MEDSNVRPPLSMICPFPDCGHRNPFEEDDRGTEIYCERCGRAMFVPEAPPPPSAERVGGKVADVTPADDRGMWQFPPPRAVRQPLPARNGPATDGAGRVYAPLTSSLVALEDRDGQVHVLWEYATGGVIPGSPALHADGSLRIHSNDGKLHGVGPDGRALWPPVPIGKPLSSASPVVDAGGQTWICLASGGLARVDARGGTSGVRFFSSPARFDCTGVLWDETFVVGSEDHFVHAIDLRGERGFEKWDLTNHRGDTGWYVNAALAVASGPVFVVATSLSRLCGFGPGGEKIWDVALPGLVLGAPVVDGDDRAYVGVSPGAPGQQPQGALVCCDLRRREIAWQYAARGAVESTPVVGNDGTVYLGDNAGWIHAVTSAGVALWTWHAGRPVRSRGTLVAPQRLVFGDEAGGLIALRCDSTSLAAGWPKYMGALRQTGCYP